MKVLIVSYLFPPVGGGGVQRVYTLTNFLAEIKDYQVEVFTEHLAFQNYDVYDYNLQVDERIKVITSRGAENNRKTKSASQLATKKPSSGNKLLLIVNKLFNILKGGLLLFTPDDKTGFMFRGLLWALRNKSQPDVVIGTVRPPSNAVVAYFISVFSKAHLIIEYRDLWFGQEFQKNKKIYERINKLFEYRILKRAKKIICVSPRYIDMLVDRYPTFAHKMELITNGFPAAYIQSGKINVNEPVVQDQFVIGHFGRFYGPRKIDDLMEVLESMQDKVLFWQFGPKIENSAMDISKIKSFRYMGYVGFKESWQWQKSPEIDVLLLIEYTSDNIPGKVFEYYASNKPVVIICPLNSVLRDVFERVEGFHFLLNEEINTLREIIQRLKKDKQPPKPIVRDLRTFARENLYNRYHSIIEDCKLTNK